MYPGCHRVTRLERETALPECARSQGSLAREWRRRGDNQGPLRRVYGSSQSITRPLATTQDLSLNKGPDSVA